MQRGGSGSDQAGVASVLAALLPAGTCRKGLRSHDTEALLERQVSMLSMPRAPHANGENREVWTLSSY